MSIQSIKSSYLFIAFLYLCAFIVMTALYTGLSGLVPLNSDSVSLILEARDVAKGNIFLRGWYLSTESYYFTEVLFYALIIRFIGWHTSLYYIMPSIILSAIIIVSFLIIRHKRNKSLWFLLVVFGCVTPISIRIILIPCIHMSTYFWLLIAWLILIKSNLKLNKISYISLFLIISLTAASDDLSIYIFIIPLILSCLFYCIKNLCINNLKIVLLCLLSFLGSHCIKALLRVMGAFSLPGVGSATFVSKEKLPENLYLSVVGTLDYFNADFFGKKLATASGINAVIHFGVIVLIIFLFYNVCKNFKNLEIIDLSFTISSIIVVFAYTISTMPVDIYTTRYLVAPYFLSIIVISRWFIVFSWIRIASITGAISYYILTIPAPTWNFQKTNQGFLINTELSRHGLTQGFASYWSGAVNSLPYSINIAPVIFSPHHISAYHWLSKVEWYKNGGNFMLCDNQDEVRFANIEFGNPKYIENINGKFLIVWDHVIYIKD